MNILSTADNPAKIYWCQKCDVPLALTNPDEKVCSLCANPVKYLSSDLRPVFPEEIKRIGKNNCAWAKNQKYYSCVQKATNFDKYINKVVKANKYRINLLTAESHSFIKDTAKDYQNNQLVISFSGGKDSTVIRDLVIKAMSNPALIHIFGDTTLEFDSTYDYIRRFIKENPNSIIKVAKNKEQNFYDVAADIGPPARMMRWCCFMFKTGPISRVINRVFGNEKKILTFYGIRKSESVSRSKYNRIEDSGDVIKIQKQKVAAPIFHWIDFDVWLYIFANKLDFNDAYKFGYRRVGCYLCPCNNSNDLKLSKIFMHEKAQKWENFLLKFSKEILEKPDYEEYVFSGAWKARQGGNNLKSAEDVKIKYTNCTTENNALVYELNKPITSNFYELFIPFGNVNFNLGKLILNEVLILDPKTTAPIISIMPFEQDGNLYSVKIKLLNMDARSKKNITRKIEYQIRKYNACRSCLKCESLCRFNAISIIGGKYNIDKDKCQKCNQCVSSKFLSSGCLMSKYLRTKVNKANILS